MPHTDVIPTSASIASTGTSIRYVGQFAYGLSGTVGVANSTVTLLSFQSGSGVIQGIFNFHRGSGANSGDDYLYKILFNGEELFEQLNSGFQSNVEGYIYPTRLIIPPLTIVTVTAINNDSSAVNKIAVTFSGRVYGAA